jgi:hypothetical protein
MPIAINGTGTITGISAGGLPDAIITGAELDGAQTGSAPIYGARAWVNFNGTGTVAIRASGNVSSITDNNTGDYTVNFTTAMPDVNYSAVLAPSVTVGSYTGLGLPAQPFVFNTGSTRFNTQNTDCAAVSVAIFR